MSLRVWRGCHRGEDLAIGIACDRPTPWNRWPEHTHTTPRQLIGNRTTAAAIEQMRM